MHDKPGLEAQFMSVQDHQSVFRRGRCIDGITKLVYGDIEIDVRRHAFCMRLSHEASCTNPLADEAHDRMVVRFKPLCQQFSTHLDLRTDRINMSP